jgi:hypothetical protein
MSKGHKPAGGIRSNKVTQQSVRTGDTLEKASRRVG